MTEKATEKEKLEGLLVWATRHGRRHTEDDRERDGIERRLKCAEATLEGLVAGVTIRGLDISDPGPGEHRTQHLVDASKMADYVRIEKHHKKLEDEFKQKFPEQWDASQVYFEKCRQFEFLLCLTTGQWHTGGPFG